MPDTGAVLDTGVRSDPGAVRCGVVSSWELAAVVPAVRMQLSAREGLLRDPHLMEGFFPWIGRFPSFAVRAAACSCSGLLLQRPCSCRACCCGMPETGMPETGMPESGMPEACVPEVR